MPMPMRDERRNTAIAIITIGERMRIAEWAGLTKNVRNLNVGKPTGFGNPSTAESLPWITPPKKPRNDAKPSVATTLISLGARRRRRTMTTSAITPPNAPMSTATAKATQ